MAVKVIDQERHVAEYVDILSKQPVRRANPLDSSCPVSDPVVYGLLRLNK